MKHIRAALISVRCPPRAAKDAVMSVAAVVLDCSSIIVVKRVIQDQAAAQLVRELSSRQQY